MAIILRAVLTTLMRVMCSNYLGNEMAQNKTTASKLSVAKYLNAIEPAAKRKDAKTIDKLMRAVSGDKPVMWGSSIIGYGEYHYVYDSGREGDSMRVGFSPRKQNLVVYIMPGFKGFTTLLKKLGKHKVSKSCLYINKLDDVDLDVLQAIVEKSLKLMDKKYPR